MSSEPSLPTIEHAGLLEDRLDLPAFLHPDHAAGSAGNGTYSCSYCGVGDGGMLSSSTAPPKTSTELQTDQPAMLRLRKDGELLEMAARIDEDGRLEVATPAPLTTGGGVLNGELVQGDQTVPLTAREAERKLSPDGALDAQIFVPYRSATSIKDSVVKEKSPTSGCVKLKLSLMRQKSAFPIHTAPSVLDRDAGARRTLSYQQAIERLAELLLTHRGAAGRSLVYASGQIDYFTIFAMQEVFRLLGMRNLTGNAEHCLNAGAIHNEILTGQEGPFLTLEQSIVGGDRFYIFNGWNGLVSHPPAFAAILRRKDLDAYLIEVQVTESAKAVAKKLGPERVLLIRPRSDPHLALAVAHEILQNHSQAVEQRFIERFSDTESFAAFRSLAADERFEPARVAERIAPEPQYVKRLVDGIRAIAKKIAWPGVVPINIPSVGLSQTSGVVAHCLWGSTLAMLGKYGIAPDGEPLGGTLRIPGQINAETEVQGLSRKFFMGRLPIEQATEAAQRMDLPDDAYQGVLDDEPRAALDYSDPAEKPELFLFFGTQFEANMMGRPRWLKKLADPNVKFVVVDPIPDPYTIERAELIVPSPPHPATTKLYQNGEWKLTLSAPWKRAPKETRSDATIIYDVMAEIARRLQSDPQLCRTHPDLARHLETGYLGRRFCPPREAGDGLARHEGEVSRPQLWQRIQDYMGGGCGPIYCRPEHADGRTIDWHELLEQGSLVYGGVGENRFALDYATADAAPFRDIFRQPSRFKFFVPRDDDLNIPDGILLNSGRSCLSDDKQAVLFATSTFNSGKATPVVGMPADNPLHVSPQLATRLGLISGGWAKVTCRESGESEIYPVNVTDRVKGETVYMSFHKTQAALDHDRCVNTVTQHVARCPYSGQTQVKCTPVLIEPAASPAADG